MQQVVEVDDDIYIRACDASVQEEFEGFVQIDNSLPCYGEPSDGNIISDVISEEINDLSENDSEMKF